MEAEDETKVVNRESLLAEGSDPPNEASDDGAGPSVARAVEDASAEREPVESGSSANADLLDTSRLVGRYELIHRLGHGGMATVFVGRAMGTAGFERLVAVKVIHPHLAREPEFVEMFLDEARIAAKIHDANVVETIDLGEDEGVFFMVMEYVEGETLSALLRQLRKANQTLPLIAALQIVVDSCRGLAAAHELCDRDGAPLLLVHRDVSPHNLLVGMNGRLKVVDFGIMKAAGKRSNTLTGQLRGKIAYMPPEQARGHAVDQRTDIFAVGAVLWELVTGQRLFAGEAESEVLERVLKFEGPKLDPEHGEFPEGLSDILRKSLAPSPDDRYETARDMVSDVRALMRRIRDDHEPRELIADAMRRFFLARVEYVRATIRDHAAGERRDASALGLASSEFGSFTPSPTGAGARYTPPHAPTGTLPAALPEKRRSLIPWLVLPAIGAAAGVVVLSGALDKEPQPDLQGQATSKATVEPAASPKSDAPEEPAMVTWWFNTDPQGATILIDGKAQAKPTPLAVQLPQARDTVLVRVEHEGYKPRELRMAPLGPENHSLRLEALPKALAPGEPLPLHFRADPKGGKSASKGKGKARTLPHKKFKAPRKGSKDPDSSSKPPDNPTSPSKRGEGGDDRKLEDMPNFGGVKTTAKE